MIYLYIFLFVFVVFVFLGLFFPSANIFFQMGILKKYKKIQFESSYYREILSYSPSEIFYIYQKNFKEQIEKVNLMNKNYEKLIKINLLKMELLGYVDIDYSNSDDFHIIAKDILILDEEYSLLYNFIFNKITSEKEISLYEIYNYFYNNPETTFLLKWDNLIKEKIRKKGFYEGNFITFYGDKIKKYYTIVIPILIIIDLILMFISFKFGLIMIPIFAVFLIFGYYETKSLKVVSDKGVYEYRKIKALKKFLKDFSIVNEKGPEYVKLLEDYIIYANIFGMSKDDSIIKKVQNELEYITKSSVK